MTIKNAADNNEIDFAAQELKEKKRARCELARLKRYIRKRLALPGALTVRENMNFIDALLKVSHNRLINSRVSYTDRAKRSCIPRNLISIGKTRVSIYRGAKDKNTGYYDSAIMCEVLNKLMKIKSILIGILRETSSSGIMLKKGKFLYNGSSINYTIQHFVDEHKVKLSYLSFRKKDNGGTYLVARITYVYNTVSGRLCYVGFERKKGNTIRSIHHGYIPSFTYNHAESQNYFIDFIIKLRLAQINVNVIEERKYLNKYSVLKAFLIYPHIYATFVNSFYYPSDVGDRYKSIKKKLKSLDFYSKFYKKYPAPSGIRKYTSRSIFYYYMYEIMDKIYSYDAILKFFESISKRLSVENYNYTLCLVCDLVQVFIFLIHYGYSKNRLYKLLLGISVMVHTYDIIVSASDTMSFHVNYFVDIQHMYQSLDLPIRSNIDLSRFRNLRELHDHLAMLTQRKELSNKEFEYSNKIEEFKEGVFTANRVFDRDNLKLLGIQLNNCVGGYYSSIERKECEIYYVKEGQEYILAIEVRNNKVWQCKAYGNSRLPKEHKYREIAEKVCDFYGFNYTDCYDLPSINNLE